MRSTMIEAGLKFVAKDSQGGEITLVVHEIMEMFRRIETEQGRAVKRIKKGEYQIVGGALVTSDDPTAP